MLRPFGRQCQCLHSSIVSLTLTSNIPTLFDLENLSRTDIATLHRLSSSSGQRLIRACPQARQLHPSMPLIVPNMSGNTADQKSSDWMNKLAGKKLGDTTDTTVRSYTVSLYYFNSAPDH